MRIAFVALVTLSSLGCRTSFDDFVPDAIAETWTLTSVTGLLGCTSDSGNMQIIHVEDLAPMGDFSWMASCDDNSTIAEAADVTEVIIEERARAYTLTLERTGPSPATLEWSCAMNLPNMSCTESGPDGVVVFDFTISDA